VSRELNPPVNLRLKNEPDPESSVKIEAQKSSRRASFDGYSAPKKLKLGTGSLHSVNYLTEDENSRHESEFDDVVEIEGNDDQAEKSKRVLTKLSVRSPSSLGIKTLQATENSSPEPQFEDVAEENWRGDQALSFVDQIDIFEPKVFSGYEDLQLQIVEETPSESQPEPDSQDRATSQDSSKPGLFKNLRQADNYGADPLTLLHLRIV
jgi:hypothetical protein